MPFGTVWWINLQPIGGGVVGSGGGITGTPTPAPQRATVQYTSGQGFFTPMQPTTGTAPLLGPTGNIPLFPYVFGVDFDESATVPIKAMTSGASQTISQAVSLPDIPAIQLDPTDSGTVLVVPQVYLNPIVPGLLIASVQCEAQALQASTGQWIPAVDLSPGDTYTAVRAMFTVGLYAAAATTATNLVLSGATQVVIFSS